MNFKTFFGPPCILALALWSAAVSAAPLDKSASSKIDEAINVHYLSTNFEKAEGLLQGTLKACGERCSPAVKARAWMYIGIVRGAGKQDTDGATAAFVEALAIDPGVQLDKDLATEELQALFAAAQGGSSEATTEEVPLVATETVTEEAVPAASTMECSPELIEVETRRPIPVVCKTEAPASRVAIYYKAFGSSQWSQVTLGKSGDGWTGQIPCSATGIQGTLSWYVKASASNGKGVDTYGTESEPLAVEMVQSTSMPAPALPGKPAPARCMDPADCPEEMRGTPACPGTEKGGGGGGAAWGDSCKENGDCSDGLYCADGTCESPPSCETDADCSGGICQEFLCKYPDGGGDDDDSPGAASSKKNFFGLIVGLDLAQMDGTGVCNPLLSGGDYQCYVYDYPYVSPTIQSDAMGVSTGVPSPYHNPLSGSPSYDPARSGQVKSGLSPSMVRVMAAFEHVFTSKISGEGRLGYAFGGAPGSGFADKLHLSARGKYWFAGVGPSLRMFGVLGAGYAPVTGNKGIVVQDFEADGGPFYANFSTTSGECFPTAEIPHCQFAGTAYKKMGPGFISAGLGAFFDVGGHGPSVEVNAEILLPSSGLVIQPTAGWMVGF